LKARGAVSHFLFGGRFYERENIGKSLSFRYSLVADNHPRGGGSYGVNTQDKRKN
jgi:hypothetical protein